MSTFSGELVSEPKEHGRIRRIALSIAKTALRRERDLPLWREEPVREENVDYFESALDANFVRRRTDEVSDIAGSVYFRH